jgi:Domain of unknown function (DUF1877)
MSMIGRFVQVAPTRLAEIVDNPELAMELLAADGSTGPLGAALAPGPLSDSMRQALLERAPKLLAASMAAMDPKMREMIKKRLEAAGVNTNAMASEIDADALVKLMTERGRALAAKFGPQPPRKTPGPSGKSSQGANISIDKAWHGVHYLLCGQVDPGVTISSQAVMGGTEVGEDLGYGPARYFEADKVREIANELGHASLEAEMIARFDPVKMSTLGIYPNGWKPGDVDWLMEEFRRLRQFYADASAGQFAVVTSLE